MHWYVLGEPVAGRTPGVCRDCGAAKDWPALVDPAPGRPFILRDPLLPRLYETGRMRYLDYY